MQTWLGVVENRKDPLKVGRVQVRIIGAHTPNKKLIPTAELPWSSCLTSATDSLKEGDYVLGTYLDGSDAQQPFVFGSIAGIPSQILASQDGFSDPRSTSDLQNAPRSPKSITVGSQGVEVTEQAGALRNPFRLDEPTTSRMARNEKISETAIQVKKDSVTKSIPLPKSKSIDEPVSPYAAVYPYNHVMETESGHVIEFDDTPGAERIHIYHRSGTSDEIHPDGTKVSRVHADSFEIVLADKHIYVNGDCSITAKKAINLKAGTDLNIEVGGRLNLKADGLIAMQALGITAFSAGPLNLQGLPLNLNGFTPPPLGAAPGAIVIPAISTTTVLALPAPVASEPGNVVLEQRPGANLGTKKPNEASTQTPTPQGLPVPAVPNTEPVPTISTAQGADVMIRALNRAGLSDPTQRAMIYAQSYHESSGFKNLVESFRYTDKGLIKTWPSRFTANNVNDYVKQPEKIANRAYGGRMGNGSEASGDGFTYRGRGFIQITGKENYLEASKSFNQDFVTYPDATCVPDTAASIAVWYFQKGKKTGYKGSYSDVTAVTRFVNGGLIDLEKRKILFEKYKSNTIVTTLTSAV